MPEKINPETILGGKFRLAAVEIEDTRSDYDGARVVKAFARFCDADKSPNNSKNFVAARLSIDNLMDMMLVQKKRWFWQPEPALPTLEMASIFNDMARSHKLADLINVLGRAQNDYRAELNKPKLVVKTLSDLTPRG
jgi:hypothetical protein